MNSPYTHDQAKKLCEDFQYIVGSSLDGSTTSIEHLAITPFDQSSKDRFFLYYMIMDERGQEAILQEYKGFLFDVVIIAHSVTGDLLKEELGTWIARNTVFHDFPLPSSQQQNQAFI